MELASERVERLRQKAHDETKRSRRAEFQEDDAGAADRKDKPVSGILCGSRETHV